jgi:hypothetical protein
VPGRDRVGVLTLHGGGKVTVTYNITYHDKSRVIVGNDFF